MEFQKMKKRVVAGLKRDQLADALRAGGFEGEINDELTKAMMAAEAMKLSGIPHVVTQEDLSENGLEGDLKVGEVIWLPEPTEGDAPEGEENNSGENEEPKHIVLLNVKHNGRSYEKGKMYNLSTQEVKVLKGLGAL